MSTANGLLQIGLSQPAPQQPQPPQQGFDLTSYLAAERAKGLLRLSTAGSVDDGKSTLIGRLLYDTQSVYDDQIRSIEGKGTTAPGVLDLALLTDGLRAEREQGITIDVAYRYFSTHKRKFIIADTPGHEQYTRNMATGASTADVAVVLIDARKGVLIQSRRHAYITALLGVPHLIIAVNKMDLTGYDAEVFRAIERDFRSFFADLQIPGSERTGLHFVPVSALEGDNVVTKSTRMDWYAGPTLLDLLETLPAAEQQADAPFRMPVQRVVRPDLHFRGFAGQIASGTVRPGDRIAVLPSGATSRVERIVTFDGDLAEASAPMSVTLTLKDEVDVSRGDLIATEREAPAVTHAFTASLVWMDATPLQLGRRYLLKNTSRTVNAEVRSIVRTIDLSGSLAAGRQETKPLQINGIAEVEVETTLPIVADPYERNRHAGSFVLIDRETNATVAAGMIRTIRGGGLTATVDRAVTAEERILRYGHIGAHVTVRGPEEFAQALERALFLRGAFVLRWSAELPGAITPLVERGALVITSSASEDEDLRVEANGGFERIGSASNLPLERAVDRTFQFLKQSRVLNEREGL